MLFSTDTLKTAIRKYLYTLQNTADDPFQAGTSGALLTVVKMIEDTEEKNGTIDRPAIVIAEDEKGVILYCDSELWQYIQEIRNNNIDKMGIGEVAQIWLKLKKILKKQTTVTTTKEKSDNAKA